MSELEQVQPKAPPERPSALNMFTVSPRDRVLAAGTVIWCFLAVDTVLYAWPWGMGFTAAVWGWYVLLGAVVMVNQELDVGIRKPRRPGLNLRHQGVVGVRIPGP